MKAKYYHQAYVARGGYLTLDVDSIEDAKACRCSDDERLEVFDDQGRIVYLHEVDGSVTTIDYSGNPDRPLVTFTYDRLIKVNLPPVPSVLYPGQTLPLSVPLDAWPKDCNPFTYGMSPAQSFAANALAFDIAEMTDAINAVLRDIAQAEKIDRLTEERNRWRTRAVAAEQRATVLQSRNPSEPNPLPWAVERIAGPTQGTVARFAKESMARAYAQEAGCGNPNCCDFRVEHRP